MVILLLVDFFEKNMADLEDGLLVSPEVLLLVSGVKGHVQISVLNQKEPAGALLESSHEEPAGRGRSFGVRNADGFV